MTGPLIGLLTDFGLRDAYAGIMKAVVLTGAPEACLIDLTHPALAADNAPPRMRDWRLCSAD